MKLATINKLNEEAEIIIAKLKNNLITQEEGWASSEKIINKIVKLLGEDDEYVQKLRLNFKLAHLRNQKYIEFKENLKKLKEQEIALNKEFGINM